MKLEKLLYLSLPNLRFEFKKSLPYLYQLAQECNEYQDFFEKFAIWIHQVHNSIIHPEAEQTWSFLLAQEGKIISELSTGLQIRLSTIEMLYTFLRAEEGALVHVDALLDLYSLLTNQMAKKDNKLSTLLSRWASGLDKTVIDIRTVNKQRIVSLLVDKISKSISVSSRYVFTEGMSREEQERQVTVWWNDYRFHLAMAIRTPAELNLFLGNTLSEEQMKILYDAKKKQIPFFVTPYYLSLLDISGDGYDDKTLRSYILYSRELVDAFGSIKAWEKEDRVVPGKPNAAGWILPEGGEHPSALSRGSHPDTRFNGKSLWRLVCFLPAHV